MKRLKTKVLPLINKREAKKLYKSKPMVSLKEMRRQIRKSMK